MKHIYLNLKRFDVPRRMGGVNGLAPVEKWAEAVVNGIQNELKEYDPDQVEFSAFFPELHILNAWKARGQGGPLKIGCQGVLPWDVSQGGNFGAFTCGRPAAAMKAAGCEAALIGHCEERAFLSSILKEADAYSPEAECRILNQEIKRALERNMEVLYCIGEKSQEQDRWREVLGMQLDKGLEGVDKSKVVIAYEPIWSIGPGKTPAGQEYITKIARFVKEKTSGMDVVYGGGLKKDNAKMLASIPEIDGGLIALTRFSGQVGFYCDEYLEIIRHYMDGQEETK